MAGRDFISRAPNLRDVRFPLANASDVGAKGEGILNLPPNWYPPTLFISPRLHDAAAAGADWERELHAMRTLDSALTVLSAAPATGHILVRSSARAENLDNRGTFLTLQCDPTTTSLVSSIKQIWRDSAHEPDEVGFAIQPAITTLLHGHLSNEHRVSRESMQWAFECQSNVTTWRVHKSAPAEDECLEANSPATMESRLRQVARALGALSSRYHVEWIWDGNRVWIVQADPVPLTLGRPPGEFWVPARSAPVNNTALTTWIHLDRPNLRSHRDWSKVANVDLFARADLPVPSLWLLDGQSLHDMRPRATDDKIDRDLELLCDGYLIVRTDVRDDEQPGMMLPKIEAIGDPLRIRNWMEDRLDEFVADGIRPDQIAFIAHRYLRARASSWSRASPDDPNVRIDSTWGLPDGLSWLPHDTAWVNVENRTVRRSVRGKTEFLDVIEADKWDYRPTPTEWIWRASASEQMLLEIADAAKRLAKLTGSSVTTMWFLGMLEDARTEIIAWYQAPTDTTDAGDEPSPRAPRIDVRNLNDLAHLSLDDPLTITAVVRIFPTSDLVRSADFVDQVIDKFRHTNVKVELVGSPLAHPYYLMRRAGLKVTCRAGLEPTPVNHNKLVRDRIVDRIQGRGESAISFEVEGRERALLLRRKLVEEALEVLAAQSAGEEAEELADVEEVLLALRETDGISREDVETLRAAKRRKAGGFTEGLVLVATGGPREDDPAEETLPGMSAIARRLDADTVRTHGHGITLSLIPPTSRWSMITKIGHDRFRIEYQGSRVTISPVDPEFAREEDSRLF